MFGVLNRSDGIALIDPMYIAPSFSCHPGAFCMATFERLTLSRFVTISLKIWPMAHNTVPMQNQRLQFPRSNLADS